MNDYLKMLERVVKGAEYLGNPLIKSEDYEKGIKLYDELCRQALEMRGSHESMVKRKV